MSKFKRLKITLATVLRLIGGNKASNSTVNAETPKSTSVNKVSENSKSKGNSKNVMSKEQKDLFDAWYAVGTIIGSTLFYVLSKKGSKKNVKFVSGIPVCLV